MIPGKREASSAQLSTQFDRSVWIPAPLVFKKTKWADPADWAFNSMVEVFGRERGVVTRETAQEEVLPRAQLLLKARHDVAGKVPAQGLYFHCPDSVRIPVLVGVGLWKARGTREEALEYYSRWDSEAATTPVVAETFSTEALGDGRRCSWRGENELGAYDQINYAFRDEEQETDLHVFMGSCWDHRRTEEVATDLEAFVRVMRFLPAPAHHRFGRRRPA